MKVLLKIGKLFAILFVTISIILIVASFLLKDKVGYIILRSVNRNLSTKVDVGSYRLSFLKKFPKASLELKNVLVHSSKDFDAASFIGMNTDTLLFSRGVSVEFKLTDILKGVYTIERIGARNGKLNLFTDNDDNVNYNITAKNNDHPGSPETIIDLERINLTDITAFYCNLSDSLTIGGEIRAGKLKSRITGSNIEFTAGSELNINRFDLKDFRLAKSFETRLDLELQSSKNGINFKKGTLDIGKNQIGLTGSVYSGNLLDLEITGKNLDLSEIHKYLPKKILEKYSEYTVSGILNGSCKIKGLVTKNSNPFIDLNWEIKNGKVTNKTARLTFSNLSFSGNCTNGQSKKPETTSLEIKDFHARFGSSVYTGWLLYRNFKDPVIGLSFKGRLIPDELKDFFKIERISEAKGTIDVDLKINNRELEGRKVTVNEIIDLNPEGDVKFNSLTIGFHDKRLLFSNVDGNLKLTGSIHAKDLRLSYLGQKIRITGEFIHLPEWLAGRRTIMTAKGDMTFDKFVPMLFFKQAESGPASKPEAVSLPGDVKLNIHLKADSLIYKTFRSSQVEGDFNYQPKTLTYKSLRMKSLNGVISGDGFFLQNKDKSLLIKGVFNVEDINVNKAFITFHNFGQSFLKAENIKGTLSGSLSLLLPLDSLLNFRIKTLTAEGKYHLSNGALVNFDPVKQLSRFIELSELENIKFDKLENDFFIRNNQLFIPQMDVNSSAADLSVNGKHSFDNEYEYHVKIRLSEILSRKRAKNKSNITEFGEVEDDGLGRTSLLLKIAGKGDVAKVGYDVKAAGNEVRNNISKERTTLRQILKEEYGMYSTDSTLKKKPEEKKPKFKIKWDGE